MSQVIDLKNRIQKPIFLYDFTVSISENKLLSKDLLPLIVDIEVPILNFSLGSIQAGVFHFPVFEGLESRVLTLKMSMIEDYKYSVFDFIKRYKRAVMNDDGTFNEPINYVFDLYVKFGSDRTGKENLSSITGGALSNVSSFLSGGLSNLVASVTTFSKTSLSSKISGKGFYFKNCFLVPEGSLKFSTKSKDFVVYNFTVVADRMDYLE